MSLPDFSTQAELFSTAGLSASLFAPTDRYRLFAKVVYPHLVRARSSLEPCYCANNGRLALEPVLMLGVSLLQYLDGVPDRQAVELLRYHAGWNFALNRQLGDLAFHPSSLVNFRNRLEHHQQSALAFTAVLEALQEAGLVSRQSRQRLDSTQMLGRVARMSRLDCVRESLRLALQKLEVALRPEDRPGFWLGLWERYVESQTDYRASSETLARKLVEAGSDAWQLLQWLDQPEGAALAQGPQVQLLRRVFAEQFELGVGPGKPAPREKILVASDSPGSEAAPLVEAQAPAAEAPAQTEPSVVSPKAESAAEALPQLGGFVLQSNPQIGAEAGQLSQPAPEAAASSGAFIQPKAKAELSSDRVQNPHEPQATYAAKGQGEKKKEHVGYKIQVAETVCEATLAVGEPTRNFIVGMVTHPAYESDEAGAQRMETEQSAMGLEKPAVQYVDGAYVSAEKLVEAAAQGRQLIGPAAAPPNNNDSRFTTEAFQIEVEHRQATCPAGQPNSQCSRLEEKATGKVSYRFEWDTATCAACRLRQQCIKAEQKHRTLVVGEHHTALQTRRQEQRTAAFKEQMKHRNGIEGTQSELVRGHGLREARYRGLAKAKLQNYFIGAACNVKRWLRRLAWELEEAARASTKIGTVLAS
jgi:transposase